MTKTTYLKKTGGPLFGHSNVYGPDPNEQESERDECEKNTYCISVFFDICKESAKASKINALDLYCSKRYTRTILGCFTFWTFS